MLNIRKAIFNPLGTVKAIYKKVPRSPEEAKHLYYYFKYKLSSEDYMDFYKKLQNKKIQEGFAYDWDSGAGIGQFRFLKRNGLSPEHRLLDIGCGNLRGGIHSIRYLNTGNYFGMDISSEAIESGRNILEKEGLLRKNPTLWVNDDLSFRKLKGKKFDFIIAQSVFTHLPIREVKECFKNIGKIMKRNGIFLPL